MMNTVKLNIKPIVNAIKETRTPPPQEHNREIEEEASLRQKRLFLETLPKGSKNVLDIFRSQSGHDLSFSCNDDEQRKENIESSKLNESIDNEETCNSSMKFSRPELFEYTPSKPLLEQLSEEVKTPDGIKMTFDFLGKSVRHRRNML